MGPRSDERGNEELVNLYKRSIKYLQWGRAQMSAEIRRIGYVVRGRRCSSMGPRSDERGNALLQICLEAPLQSSMGPRSDERGNVSFRWLNRRIVAPLQWGRAQMSAEIASGRQREAIIDVSSMGPRSDERGNRLTFRAKCELDNDLQWGRAQMSAEIASSAHAGPGREALQWGRAQMSAEIKSWNSQHRDSRTVFNGAALR